MKGYYKKYSITKADGRPCDPDAEYFVLRLDTDPAARAALRTYAEACGNPVLKEELLARLAYYENTALGESDA